MFITDSGLNTKVIRKETEDKIDRYCSQLFSKEWKNAIAVSCVLNICNNNNKKRKKVNYIRVLYFWQLQCYSMQLCSQYLSEVNK